MGIVTLSNGKRVANFSMPHPIVFEDGSVVPKATKQEAERLALCVEEVTNEEGDISQKTSLTSDIWDQFEVWDYYNTMDVVDIIFVPDDIYRELHLMDYDLKETIFRGVKYIQGETRLASIWTQYV